MEQPAVKLQRLYDKLRDAFEKRDRLLGAVALVDTEIEKLLVELDQVDLPCPPTLRDGEG